MTLTKGVGHRHLLNRDAVLRQQVSDDLRARPNVAGGVGSRGTDEPLRHHAELLGRYLFCHLSGVERKEDLGNTRPASCRECFS
jgi:hypothetical protein